MNKRRIQFFFTVVFVSTGVAIGLIWALRELKHPTADVATAPVEEKPFLTVDEALAEDSDGNAEHMRQLLVTEEPMPQLPDPAAPLTESAQTTMAVALPPSAPISVEGGSASVVYDAGVEAENTRRLVDSFAPLRDPAVSLDSPENRQAILQMQANAAKRAMEASQSLPMSQR